MPGMRPSAAEIILISLFTAKFDLGRLTVVQLLTAGVLGQLQGIGAGTVIGALTYGPLAGVWGKFLDKRFTFVSVLAPQGPGQG